MGVTRRKSSLDDYWHQQAAGKTDSLLKSAQQTAQQAQYNSLTNLYDQMAFMNQPTHQLDGMRYALEAQKQRLEQERMAVAGKYGPGYWTGTTSDTFSGCTISNSDHISISRDDAERVSSKYWEREYHPKYNEVRWKLNHRRVHEILTDLGRQMPADPRYHRLRDDPSYFDSKFGRGAYQEYLRGPLAYEAYGEGHIKGRPDDPRMSPEEMYREPKPKPFVPPKVKLPTPFKIESGNTLLAALRRSFKHVNATSKFKVGENETLLQALQRDMNTWLKRINISTEGAEKFVINSGHTITIGRAP